ncbi:10730_t:CDS:1, partial [Ambispora gerdemannii]
MELPDKIDPEEYEDKDLIDQSLYIINEKLNDQLILQIKIQEES